MSWLLFDEWWNRTDGKVKGTARDFASMIGGGGQYQSLGMETSSHGHGGSISEDFVSHVELRLSLVCLQILRLLVQCDQGNDV